MCCGCIVRSVYLCSILGGRALGLSFSRPKILMSLKSVSDLTKDAGEQQPVVGTVGESQFNVDGCGFCKAEFHSVTVHVENMQNGRNVALQKYVFEFNTQVTICSRLIPVQVSRVHY